MLPFFQEACVRVPRRQVYVSYILLRSLHTPPLVTYSARYILLRSLGGCDWLSVGGRSAHASVLPGGVRPRPAAPSVSVLHTPPLATPPFARRLRLAFRWRSVRPCFVSPGGVRPRPAAPHTPPLATYSARYILRSLHTPPFARRLRLAFRWRSVRPCFGASRRRASASRGAKCKCLTYSSARYILLRSLGGCDWLSVGGRSAHASVLPGGVRPRPAAPSVSALHTPPLATYSSVRSAAATGFPLAVGPPMLRCFQEACLRVPRRQVSFMPVFSPAVKKHAPRLVGENPSVLHTPRFGYMVVSSHT